VRAECGADDIMLSRRLTILFVALIGAGCLAGVVVPAGIGWDFANFYDAGRRVATGAVSDLYQPAGQIAGAPPQGSTGFFGTPISAALYTPMAGLSPGAALVWFKIANVAAFFAAFWMLFRFYRAFQPASVAAMWRFAAMFSGFCLVFQPFWTVFRVGGQTTPFVFLLLSSGLLAHTRGRLTASAICVVVSTLIKPALAPMLLFLMCVSGWPFFGAAVLALLVAGAASLFWLGWPVHAQFLTLMRESGQTTWAWYYNSSIYIVVSNIRVSFLIYGIQAAVAGAVAWLTWQGHQRAWTAAPRRHFDFLMSVLLFVLVTRTLWEHYLSLLFLPLIYVVATREQFSRRALVLVIAIAGLSVFQNLVFTMWLRGAFTFSSPSALVAVTIFKSSPLLLTLLFFVRHHREWLRSFAAWPPAVVPTDPQ
jgi:hypothetical protein